MKKPYRLNFYFVSFLIVIIFSIMNCEAFNNWKDNYVKERYGKTNIKKEKIPEWQKDLKEYESILEEKIEASDKTAKLYRKLGETFANMGAYDLCIKNLQKAINLGHHYDKVFYTLGLCQGSKASLHNWNYKMTKAAEETFLSLLKKNPEFDKAKFQLGLLYFHGFTKHNKYQINANFISISQIKFRKKAIALIRESQHSDPNNIRTYFALAQIYRIMNQNNLALTQMSMLIELLKKQYPSNYQKLKEYKQAEKNYKILAGTH